MEIYLTRHGKLDWSDNKKRCIGITDVNLSEEGLKKAKEIGEFLEDKNISKIYTSDLNRCRKTAEIICEYLKIPYYTEKSLREINMGIWENKTFDEIKRTYPVDYEKRGQFISNYKIFGAETYEECYERSINILIKICEENNRKDDGNILILTHSGVIKCMLSYIEKTPLNNILDIKQNYGAINCITYENEEFKINYCNK